MIVCLCRGVSDRKVNQAIENGASSVRDLQRCGIGGQCGSCHNMLRNMLAQAAQAASQPCPTHVAPQPASAVATA